MAAQPQILRIDHISWLPSRRSLAEASVASEGHDERAPRAAVEVTARAEALPRGQEGGKAGSERLGFARFAPRRPPQAAGSNLLLASRGNIFGFGPPKTKMRSRSPADLPAFPPSCALARASAQAVSSTAARVARWVLALGCHGSFCKRAAAGQPRETSGAMWRSVRGLATVGSGGMGKR